MEQRKTNIILMGFMGSGKSTIGKLLSQEMKYSFIDLDSYIEHRYHKTINHLFDEKGEEEFRQIESEMLREVLQFEEVVISTGGGTPCFNNNLELIRQSGITVYIEVDEDIICARLAKAKISRPLIKQKSEDEIRDYVRETILRRAPFYEQADIIHHNSTYHKQKEAFAHELYLRIKEHILKQN